MLFSTQKNQVFQLSTPFCNFSTHSPGRLTDHTHKTRLPHPMANPAECNPRPSKQQRNCYHSKYTSLRQLVFEQLLDALQYIWGPLRLTQFGSNPRIHIMTCIAHVPKRNRNGYGSNIMFAYCPKSVANMIYISTLDKYQNTFRNRNFCTRSTFVA